MHLSAIDIGLVALIVVLLTFGAAWAVDKFDEADTSE